MRLLLDQGLPRSSAEILRNKGWDIQHTGEIGMSRATDRQILEYARDEQRIIITLDSDFHAILAVENLDSPSVVGIRQEGLRSPELAELVEKIWSRIGQQLENGAMATMCFLLFHRDRRTAQRISLGRFKKKVDERHRRN